MQLSDTGMWTNQNLSFTRALRDMILQAEAILMAALLRNESRGAHYKPAFRERDDAKFLKATMATYDAETDSATDRLWAGGHEPGAAAGADVWEDGGGEGDGGRGGGPGGEHSGGGDDGGVTRRRPPSAAGPLTSLLIERRGNRRPDSFIGPPLGHTGRLATSHPVGRRRRTSPGVRRLRGGGRGR